MATGLRRLVFARLAKERGDTAVWKDCQVNTPAVATEATVNVGDNCKGCVWVGERQGTM